MSERGVFAVDRSVFEHERFANEPYSEREAWIWMIGQAAFRPHRRRVGSARVELKRGQLAHSLRFMAAQWQWSEPRVRRFLARLKGAPERDAKTDAASDATADAMIDVASDAGVTVITIRNYDAYQRVSLPDDAPSDAGSDAAPDAGSDAAPTQQRRKEESMEGKERIIHDTSPTRTGAPTPAIAISDAAHAFAAELATIAGHNPQFLPPRWVSAGPAVRVQLMLDAGWRIETMRETARAAMRRKRDGPPVTIRYFETVFANAHAPQAALPQPPPNGETAHDETASQTRLRLLRPIRGKGLAAFALARARGAG